MTDAARAHARALVVATSIRVLNVASVVLASLTVEGLARWSIMLLAVAVGAFRMWPNLRWRSALGSATALMLVAATIASLTGGFGSIAFGAVIVASADVGVIRGGGAGALVGTAGALLSQLVWSRTSGVPLTPDVVDVWVLLLAPFAGLAFGTVHRDQPLSGPAAMRATTAALDDLVRLTERMPAGLDLWSVADAILEEVREIVEPTLPPGSMPSNRAHVLIGRAGVLRGTGEPWDRRPVGLVEDLPRQRRGQPFVMVELAALPEGLRELLVGQPRWYLHRLGDAAGAGAVLVPGTVPSNVLPSIQEALRTADLALSNVDRFERLQEVAASAARTRLAHDLHDGVAQALTHVRFELEMLGREVEPATAAEIDRIRDAADAALIEVRRSVGELREMTTLHDAVAEHVHALQAFARAEIGFTASGGDDLPEQVRREVFRVVQESLSNALRHSAATYIEVTLEQDAELLQLFVEDDGVGIDDGAGRGVGLDAMARRAERLGGRLVVRPRRGGGTVVDLAVPLEAAAQLPARRGVLGLLGSRSHR